MKMREDLGFARACGFLTWINLTYSCDFSCPWCYASSVKAPYFMPKDVFERIVFLLKDMRAHRVLLSGGETTMHPDFLFIVQRLYQQGLKVMLNTHGLAFADASFLRQATDNGLSFVQMSLKAVNAEDFLANTGVDGFHLQREAVRNVLADKRLTLIANLTLSRYFMENFEQALTMLEDWGLRGVSISLAVPILGDDPYGGGQIPCEWEVVEFLEEYIDRLASRGLEYILRLDMPLCRFLGRKISSRLAQMNLLTGCFLRDGNYLIFDPQGGVIPCNTMTDIVLGKIGEDFSTAKEYDHFLHRSDVAATLKSLRVEDGPSCASCSLAAKCCRGCAAYKMHTAGAKSLLVEAISGR
jgi:radical SAM protein with 4Fe4S-binding SPASM domain